MQRMLYVTAIDNGVLYFNNPWISRRMKVEFIKLMKKVMN